MISVTVQGAVPDRHPTDDAGECPRSLTTPASRVGGVSGSDPVTVLVDSAQGQADDDDLDHYYCCHDENLALCGRDLTGVPVTPVTNPCVVCAELERIEEGELCDCPCCVSIPREVPA